MFSGKGPCYSALFRDTSELKLMAACPHCGERIGLGGRFTASLAFPEPCHSCGGHFHHGGGLIAIAIAICGVVFGLAAVVLSGRLWLGGSVVAVTLALLVYLEVKSRLVVSTRSAVLRWRVGLAVLLVAGMALEFLPGGLFR
jgi:uncharacterized protein (DUF983 family)